MRRDCNDSQVKALIMDWPERHGRWGAHYFPPDTLLNKLFHAVRNNGRRTRQMVKELLKEDYIFAHKGGNTISLNPSGSREIAEYIQKNQLE